MVFDIIKRKPNRTVEQIQTGYLVDHDWPDERASFRVGEPGNSPLTIVMQSPFRDHVEYRKEVATGLGQQVFLPRRPLAVFSAFKHACLCQRPQSPAENIGRDAEAGSQLVELGQPECDVAQHQHTPRITDFHQAAGQRARRPNKITSPVHCIMIVTHY